jgi:hypothetical protein
MILIRFYFFKILCIAIAQLFFNDDQDEWNKHSTGIICLVRDFNLQSHFFRLFDLTVFS